MDMCSSQVHGRSFLLAEFWQPPEWQLYTGHSSVLAVTMHDWSVCLRDDTACTELYSVWNCFTLRLFARRWGVMDFLRHMDSSKKKKGCQTQSPLYIMEKKEKKDNKTIKTTKSLMTQRKCSRDLQKRAGHLKQAYEGIIFKELGGNCWVIGLQKRQDNFCPSTDHIVLLKLHSIKPGVCMFPLTFYINYKKIPLNVGSYHVTCLFCRLIKGQCPWCCCLSILASCLSARPFNVLLLMST